MMITPSHIPVFNPVFRPAFHAPKFDMLRFQGHLKPSASMPASCVSPWKHLLSPWIIPIGLILAALGLVQVHPVSRPQTLLNQPDTTNPFALKKYRVAVIDNFADREETIDDDEESDLTHGRTVVDHLKSKLGDDVDKVTIKEAHVSPLSFLGIHKTLKQLKTEGPWDAMNISLGIYGTIEALAEIAGIPDLNAANLAQHRETILQKLDSWKGKDDLSSLKSDAQSVVALWNGGVRDLVMELETLPKSTHVFIAGGNCYGSINLLSLARGKNIHVVGGVDASGKPVSWASNSSLDTEQEQAEFPVVPIYDTDGKTLLGANYTGNNKIDVFPGELTSRTFKTDKKLCGVSLASPRSMATFLRRQLQASRP